MPAAKKTPASKKKGAATKTALAAASPAASPAGPDPIVVLGYQLGNVLVFFAGGLCALYFCFTLHRFLCICVGALP